jgi:hypothetical protein
MFSVSIRDEVPQALSSIVRQLTAGLSGMKKINAAVGRAAAQHTKAHLFDLAGKRHRPGVALNFYEDAADAVSHRDLGGGVEVKIDKAGMAQRFYGGTIRAVNYSHLWIPVADESEGKSAGEFDDLVPIISPLTNKGVALQGDKVLFALVEEITQEEDPSVLPTSDEYAEVSVGAIDKLVTSLLRQNVETRPFAESGRE